MLEHLSFKFFRRPDLAFVLQVVLPKCFHDIAGRQGTVQFRPFPDVFFPIYVLDREADTHDSSGVFVYLNSGFNAAPRRLFRKIGNGSYPFQALAHVPGGLIAEFLRGVVNLGFGNDFAVAPRESFPLSNFLADGNVSPALPLVADTVSVVIHPVQGDVDMRVTGFVVPMDDVLCVGESHLLQIVFGNL